MPPDQRRSSDELKLPMNSTRSVSIASDKQKPVLRRKSTFKGLAMSITNAMSMRRFTRARLSLDIPKPKENFENTFKMNPDDGEKFPARKVESVIEDILNGIKKNKYDHERCSELACDISNNVKRKVKEFNIPRYKIVCNTVIGQNTDQGIQAASRSVWNSSTDNFACVGVKGEHIFAVVMVYGIYFD